MLKSEQFPYIEVVLTIGTWSLAEHVYLDTGNESGLVIPSYLSHEIVADPDWIPLRVANNVVTKVPSWFGTIEIGNRTFRTEIAAMGSQFLLGREVLDKMVVCFERGRQVSIEF